MRKTKRALLLATLSMLTLLGFSSTAQAQLCGQYGISLFVTNESGEAIRDIQIRFTPKIKIATETIVFKQDPEDAKLFRLILPEGSTLPVNYKLHISAPGFKKHSQKVKIIYCEKQDIRVKLIEKKSRAHPGKIRQ